MVDTPTAERHGVCPVCEGYGQGETPEGWCPGCHDGHDGPPETDNFDPLGSWEAYRLVQATRGVMDCPGCGAPEGYPPAGPCQNHGKMEAVAIVDSLTDERKPTDG